MIDTELVSAYITELDALRSHGREFAAAYPDIASRLDIGARHSRDPHVERVVESAAFLAARLRLMIEHSATELPMAMLSMIAPALVEPVPSMAIIQLQSGTEAQTVDRGTRFDYEISGRAMACLSTTMAITATPMTLRLRRLGPMGADLDGISIRLVGQPPRRLVLCMGNDELSAATLLDACAESLTTIEVVSKKGRPPVRIPPTRLRIHGFGPDEAVLPIRPASHHAHRLVAEFIAFPAKFRFVSLEGHPLESDSEIRLRFSRRLQLPPQLAPDLITVNRVPAINLWRAAATPFDVDGRRLEYPVRADALRYRTVECHSVEDVDLHGLDGSEPMRLDPVVGLGDVRGTSIRWDTRRRTSQLSGGEVVLYFQGLDYSTLGRQRLLAAPAILASNRDITQHIPVGAALLPVEGMGNWRGSLANAPTPYWPPLSNALAMETLVGYLQSSIGGLAAESRRGLLRDYLQRFPGAGKAGWIQGIRAARLRTIAVMRQGQPQSGLAVLIPFDGQAYPMTSRTVLKRVIGQLFESQRGLNRVQEVVIG